MKPADNMEKFIKNAALNTNPQMDQTVLNEILTAQDQAKKTKPAETQPNIRSIIMQSRITKLTAAAVIIIGLIMGLYSFNGSVDITSSAFASELDQVKENILKTKWIHSEDTISSVESWINFKTKFNASKDSMLGWAMCFNHQELKAYHYISDNNTITITALQRDSSLPSGPVEMLNQIIDKAQEEGCTLSRRKENHEGEDVDIYTFEGLEPGGDKILKATLKVNIRSQLMIEMEGVTADSQGNIIRKFLTRFDYPETGPETIYDLGVPKSAKIIEQKFEIK